MALTLEVDIVEPGEVGEVGDDSVLVRRSVDAFCASASLVRLTSICSRRASGLMGSPTTCHVGKLYSAKIGNLGKQNRKVIGASN